MRSFLSTVFPGQSGASKKRQRPHERLVAAMKIFQKKSKSTERAAPSARTLFTRRRALKGLAVAGTFAAMGPWIVRDARSSSGVLNMMMWSDYLPAGFLRRFEKSTGIRIRHSPYDSSNELFNKLRASKGRNFDLIGPATYRLLQWKPLDLLQPWDMKRVPEKGISKAFLDSSGTAASWDDATYLLPFVWGTEGIGWNKRKWSRGDDAPSYGDLWRPEMKGLVTGRPHSLLLGIGLHLDAIGQLPSKRLDDSYQNESAMRRIWSEIGRFALERKPWFRVFWYDADGQRNAFTQNDVTAGQVWDGPTTRLRNGGFPVIYQAPKEGAIGWIDGLSLPIGAENIDQAYEFVKFAYNPRNAALFSNETGYDTCVAGVERYLDKKMQRKRAEAYPGDSIKNIWWLRTEPTWYSALRNEFTDRFVAG